ncbi:MAG: hypothetical protein ACK55D_12250 [Synechococcaceae cyanobacterium]|jgi:hypothetical protein
MNSISHLHRRCAVFVACTVATIPLLTPHPAAAIVVTVDGKEYDVSVRTTSPQETPELFLPPDQGGRMPWWDNPSLAAQFAMQVFDGLGAGWNADYGPIFAYARSATSVDGVAQSLSDPNDQIVVDPAPSPSEPLAYAIAGAPVSVPLPAPILGVAVGFHWARRLRSQRHRFQSHAPAQD